MPPDPVVALTPVPPGSLRLREFQRAADDDLVTATDGERCLVIWDGRACAIPDATAARPAVFEYEVGFPLWRVFRSAIRPAPPGGVAAAGRAVTPPAPPGGRAGGGVARWGGGG